MKDLTNIPEKYHSLFTTDWNNGNDSKMISTKRSSMNELFLEFNKWEILEIIKPDVVEEEKIVGFIKD